MSFACTYAPVLLGGDPSTRNGLLLEYRVLSIIGLLLPMFNSHPGTVLLSSVGVRIGSQ